MFVFLACAGRYVFLLFNVVVVLVAVVEEMVSKIFHVIASDLYVEKHSLASTDLAPRFISEHD